MHVAGGSTSFHVQECPRWLSRTLLVLNIQGNAFSLLIWGKTCHQRQVSQGFIFRVQFSHSVVSASLRPHGLQHARPPCPSPTPSLLKLMSIALVIPSSHLILGRPLLLLPSIFPSIRIFSNESVLLIRWPKY